MGNKSSRSTRKKISNKMPIEIYGALLSPPCRAVYMTCEMLGIEYKINDIDILKGETRTPEFIKMNVRHTVPVLKDGNFLLNDSRSILMYLCDKFGGEGDSRKLYPTDLKVRAMVNDGLFFDCGTLYAAFGATVFPVMAKEKPQASAQEKLEETLSFADDMLKKSGFLAGTSHMTIADIAMAASVGTMLAMEHVSIEGYPELMKWYSKMKGDIKKHAEINEKGSEEFGVIFRPLL